MIPIQDVIPTSRPPLATIVLLTLNVLAFLYHGLASAADVNGFALALVMHTGPAHLIFNLLFLWLFGDNVEDRLGRTSLVGCYVLCGVCGVVIHSYLAPGVSVLGLGASAAIAGIVGAYFILLPHAKVLVLVPIPLSLVELPGVFFLGLFWIVQFLTFVAAPMAANRAGSPALPMLALAAACGLGAALSMLRRTQIQW